MGFRDKVIITEAVTAACYSLSPQPLEAAGRLCPLVCSTPESGYTTKADTGI